MELFVRSIVGLIAEGNVFMLANVAIFVVALAVIAERGVVITWRLRIAEAEFLGAIEKQLAAGNVDRALRLCDLAPHAPLARVVHAAIGSVSYGPDGIAMAVEEALLDVGPRIKRRVDLLWSLANVATLIGLIGTIAGLIAAFIAVGAAPGEQRTQMLTAGIAEAMNNTAFGLLIAVTCIVAHIVLSGAAKRVQEGAEHGAAKIEMLLDRMRVERARRVPAQDTAISRT